MAEEKPFRISLKLKEGKSPHLYVSQLKVMMENDTSLHPMMKRTLLMLKKTRTPFILLAKTREVVIDPLNSRHFDRSVEPRGTWICTMWSEEELKEHTKDSQGHIRAILKLFESLGYELYDSQPCSVDYIEMLEDVTSPQIEAQIKGRSQT